MLLCRLQKTLWHSPTQKIMGKTGKASRPSRTQRGNIPFIWESRCWASTTTCKRRDNRHKQWHRSQAGLFPLTNSFWFFYQWARRQDEDSSKEGVQIARYALLLLIYVDDVVFFAKSKQNMQAHLDALRDFCRHSGLQVNIAKTKVIVLGTCNKQIDVTFDGKPLWIVKSYKYFGLEFYDNYRWNFFCGKKNTGRFESFKWPFKISVGSHT